MDFRQLKRDARQLPAEKRGGVAAQLMAAGDSEEDHDDAMAACIDLCVEGVIENEHLVPHAEMILGRWNEFFPVVRALQRDPAKLDWILDDGYKALRRRGGIFLDLNWFAGIAGPFRDGKSLRSPWSRFERWDSRMPIEHIKKLLGIED